MLWGVGGDERVAELARELPALGAFGRVLRRAVRRRFPLPPLSDPQVAVLRVVESAPGIGTGAVAERLQLAPNTVSSLVRELVDGGLLLRGRDTRDRRATRLELTAVAQEGLGLWGAVRDDVLTDALQRLDPADREALAAALPAARRLVAVLDEGHAGDPTGAASRSGTTTGHPVDGSQVTAASTP